MLPAVPPLPTWSVPALIVVPPLYVFVPVSVSVPRPSLVNEPTPLITPLKVEVVPASARNVPAPALSVTALLDVIPPPAASASRVPPLKLSGPVPRLTSLVTAVMPPLRFVPPLYVFAPVSVSVPRPSLVNEPTPLITPPKATESLRLNSRRPLLPTFPTILPVVAPAPI